jgi:hypothetical protein
MTTAPNDRKRTRIYIVTRSDDGTEHLVMASQRHSAMSHVASNQYEVRRASEDDLVRLLPTRQLEVAAKKQAAA